MTEARPLFRRQPARSPEKLALQALYRWQLNDGPLAGTSSSSSVGRPEGHAQSRPRSTFRELVEGGLACPRGPRHPAHRLDGSQARAPRPDRACRPSHRPVRAHREGPRFLFASPSTKPSHSRSASAPTDGHKFVNAVLDRAAKRGPGARELTGHASVRNSLSSIATSATAVISVLTSA